MEKGWNGLPYNPISDFYKSRFNQKVYKIPVSVVDDCPNRRGLKGMQTCIFCDVWGSAARAESFTLSLSEQIQKYQAHIQKKYHAAEFLVYFQAYTNTFTKLSSLRSNFETALSFPATRGFVVGTRPDCLSQGVLDLWQEYHEKSFVAVELGVQSFFDDQLEFMRRGHSSYESLKAIEKISRLTSVDLGIHLIFGQPEETEEDIYLTAQIVNQLPITNIKLHNLHVLKNTPLEGLHAQGVFHPFERDRYAKHVALFLEHLRPDLYIHRLAAYSSRWDELIAPAWTADKMGTHQALIDYMRLGGHYQSRKFETLNPKLEQQKKNLQFKSQRIAAE